MTLRVDHPDAFSAGAQGLSLALMDARNQTLQLLTAFESVIGEGGWPGRGACQAAGVASPLWLFGHIGWFGERWVVRNLHRAAGPRCPAGATALASSEAQADAWWSPTPDGTESGTEAAAETALQPTAEPDIAGLRGWLLATQEATLELVERSDDSDDALYFARLALLHEDRCFMHLLAAAQALGLPLKLQDSPGVAPRDPLGLPATRWTLGARRTGLVTPIEAGRLEQLLPECEIDAQPVSWAQFIEFVDDGGYDRQELWQPEGWRWLQDAALHEGGRRGPRHVEQIGVASGAVLQTRFGKASRMAGHQCATHVSWWEADAWCRWAGRRLPTEAEWEYAACSAVRRGFRFGQVHEWTATTLRPWQADAVPAWAADWPDSGVGAFGRAKVLRGAPWVAPPRLNDPLRRDFALPHQDQGFTGFRSCAL